MRSTSRWTICRRGCRCRHRFLICSSSKSGPTLGRVSIGIKGVEAAALLKVRLDNMAAILDRVMTTLDENPQILGELSRGLGDAVGEIGRGSGRALEDVGQGAGGAVEHVGEGAGEAAESVGDDVGDAADELGRGAGRDVKGITDHAGDALDDAGSIADGGGEDRTTNTSLFQCQGR